MRRRSPANSTRYMAVKSPIGVATAMATVEMTSVPRKTGKAPKAKKCEAMAGLIEETKSMMEEEAEPEVMDAVLIGCAQKVEHYEIATYGTLCTWADLLGYKNAKKALAAHLDQEEKADKKLTAISKKVNQAAPSGK